MKNHQPSVCFPKKTYQTSVQQFFIEHLPTTTFQRKERNFGYKVLLVSNSDAAWHSFKATLIFICQCLLQLSPPLLPLLKLPGSDRIFVLGSVVHVYLIVASSGYTFFFCILLFGVCISWPRANPFVLSLKPWQESLNEVWKMAPADLVYPRVIFPAEKKT